jgi:TP901 family phage tail tape measure protein
MANPNVLISVNANVKQARSELDSLGRAFYRFGAQVRSVAGMASQSVTGIRQMAQGLQNLGFVMAGMVGVPLAMAMRKMSDEALDFERQMVEVQKTTGISSEYIKDLSGSIRELALATPTSATELATLAAEAGRAGVGIGKSFKDASEEILEFVRVVDMMTVSTTLSGEEAAQAFGRFLTVFQDLDFTELEELGSAINELGQSASVTEQDIVGAMLRIAPAAATLGLQAHEVAALATSITQMSESMSRGGTRVRVALEQMVLNFEQAGQLIGQTSDEIRKSINEDALGVFIELMYALGQIEDKTQRLATATEIFGTSGANAAQRFTEAFPALVGYIDIANRAFEQGTSLQMEFNRALSATKEQLAIVRDHLLEVGLAFAEDILPTVKEIISAVIPAIKQFGEVVKALTVKQKLLVAGIAVLITVGLPLLALFGSFGFAFAMMLNGVVNLIGGLIGLAATFAGMAMSGTVISAVFAAIAFALGVVLVTAISKATGTFDNIIRKLEEIGEKARNWGEGLIANIAGGIISAASTILIAAMNYVGDIISAFLEPGSPPRRGPLSTIDRWGSTLMEIFLKGFADADFGILRSIAGMVSRILQGLVSIGKLSEKKFGPTLARARELIAEIISTFNKTGAIASAAIGELSKILGTAGKELVKLLNLQLQYNKALKALEQIRAGKRDIEESYAAEVRAIQRRTDLTTAEKMALIRQARERKNLALDNANTEEDVAERNVDALGKQVDWQEQYVRAMLDQNDVWEQHIKLLKRIASALEDTAGAGKDRLADLLRQLAVNKQMQALYKKRGMDTKGLLREELSLRKRIVKELLAVEEPTSDQLALLDQNLARIKEIEAILGVTPTSIVPIDTEGMGEAVDEALSAVTEIAESVKSLSEILSDGEARYKSFIDGFRGAAPPTMEGTAGGIGLDPEDRKANLALQESQDQFYEWGRTIGSVWDEIIKKYEGFKSAWDKFKGDLQGIKDILSGQEEESEISQTIGKVGESVKGMGALVIPILLGVGIAFKIFGGVVKSALLWIVASGLWGKIGSGAEWAGGKLVTMAEKSGGMFGTLKEKLAAIPGVFRNIGSGAGALGSKILGALGTAVMKVTTWFSFLKAAPTVALKYVLDMGIKPILSAIAGGIGGLISGIASAITAVISFITMIVGVGAAILAIVAIVASVVFYIKQHWEDFKEVFAAIWENLKGAVTGFVDSFKKALGIGSVAGVKFAEILGFIYQKAEPIARFIAGALTQAFLFLSKIIKAVLPPLGKIFGSILKGIGIAAIGIIDFVGGIIEVIAGLIDWIKKGGEAPQRLLDGWEKLKTGVLEILGGLVTAIIGVLGGLLDAAGNILEELFGDQKWYQSIKDAIADVGEWFKGLGKKIKKFGKEAKKIFDKIGKALEPFAKLIGGMGKILKDMFKIVGKGFEEGGLAGAFEKLKNLLPIVGTLLEPLVHKFVDGLKALGAVIWHTITTVIIPSLLNLVKMGWGVLKANLPMWAAALLEALAKLASAVWEWVVNDFLPLIAKWMVGVGSYVGQEGPKWISNLVTLLGLLAAAMWNWITETALPWVWQFVQDVAKFLADNAPGWIQTVLTVLGDLIAALLLWIVETGVPAFLEWIEGVKTILETNLPIWVDALKTVLGLLYDEVARWVDEEVLDKLEDLIEDGKDLLAEIGTKWLTTVSTALKEVQDKFVEIFEGIRDKIKETIKEGINGVIRLVQRGINKMINGVNKIIRNINKIAIKLGLGEKLETLDHVRIDTLRKGGIAMSPMLAVVGDAPEGEAIIPLNRLEEFMGGGQPVTVNIYNPVVRNDDDLREMINVIQQQLGIQLGTKVDLLGRGMGN